MSDYVQAEKSSQSSLSRRCKILIITAVIIGLLLVALALILVFTLTNRQTAQSYSGPVLEDVKLKLTIGSSTLLATFDDNSSAEALINKLRESSPLTLTMSDYGHFEKVGNLGFTLPKNDMLISTVPGDIILYQGDKLTIYYSTNTYTFTHIAKIPDATKEGLLSILGQGDVTVQFSLE